MSKMSQWIAVAFSTWFTWLIYTSNTLATTEAKVDLVIWITWGLCAISLYSLTIVNEIMAQFGPKTHWIKAGADINILAQVFLLVVTGHWFLALVRASSEMLIRGKYNYAHWEMVWQQGHARAAKAHEVREQAKLHHQ
jgi:uncharacterized YccA/Bax inhibitor family protein